MTIMAVQIETVTYDHEGATPTRVIVERTTDAYAAALTEVMHDSWAQQGWREELHALSEHRSIQCLYDSRGIIWETREFTMIEPNPEGYVTIV